MVGRSLFVLSDSSILLYICDCLKIIYLEEDQMLGFKHNTISFFGIHEDTAFLYQISMMYFIKTVDIEHFKNKLSIKIIVKHI